MPELFEVRATLGGSLRVVGWEADQAGAQLLLKRALGGGTGWEWPAEVAPEPAPIGKRSTIFE